MLIIHDDVQSILESFEADPQEEEFILCQILTGGAWAYLEDGWIHIYSDNAEMKELVSTISHELAHKYENELKALDDEDFADRCGAMAQEAYMLAQKVI